MFRYVASQRGSATAIAVVAMMLLAVGGTSYSLATKSNLVNTQSYGQGAAAQKVAEAGVSFALAHAKATKGEIPTDTYMNLLNGKGNQHISDVAGEENMGTFNITCERNASVTETNDYKITSIGTVGTVTRTVVAFISMTDGFVNHPLSLFELIAGGSASNNKKWKIGTGTDAVATAPDKGYNQILFGDHYYANDEKHLDRKGNKGFTLNYNIKLKDIVPGHEDTDNGYGIYYLANGTGDKMSGYVVQYDPGLQPDQILVKKVVAASEKLPYRGDSTNYRIKDYDGINRTYSEWNSFQLGNQETSKIRGWDGKKLDLPASADGFSTSDKMVIPLDNVMKKLQAVNGGNPDMKGEHTITIDVRPDSAGRVVHTISIDGVEVLKFIDHNRHNQPIFTDGCTGLRVWMADVEFKNTTNGDDVPVDGVPATIRAWGEKNKVLKVTP